jgi:HEAT repeat protein
MGPHARDAAPALLGVLRDEQRELGDRQMAIEALAGIGGAHPDAVAAFVELVRREPQADDPPAPRQLRTLAVEALGVMRADAAVAAPLLVRILRSPREGENIRRRSATALGDIGPRAQIAIEPLAETLLADSSEAVRDSAAEALAKLGDPAVELLIRLARDDDAGVRWRVVKALGTVTGSAKQAQIHAALSCSIADDSQQVRMCAASALWQQTADARPILPALVDLVASDDRSIRLQAIDLLAALGPQAADAVAGLKRLEQDDREHVRRAAAQALRKIQSNAR